MSSRPLQITAIGWLLTSFGHTASAKEWQSQKDFKSVTGLAKTCGTVGWYQGSGLFLILALLNYQWSLNAASTRTPIDKAIAASAIATIWSSAVYYYRRGVTGNAVVTGAIGALQAWSVFLS